jgi:hypothetical protein
LSPEKPEALAAKTPRVPGPSTKGRTRKKIDRKVVDQVVEQVVNIDPIVPVLQTRSGRTVVKKPPFEARKN